MADTLYTLGASKLLTGDIDWDSHVIKCALVDTGAYTPDFDADEFLSDLSGAVVATSGALTDKAVTAGVATADDAVFTSVSGSTVEAIVIYRDTGVDATSSLLAYVDSAAGLPYTPTGSSVSFSWTGGVVFYLSGLQPTPVPTVVADETARLALVPSDGELVWQTDTQELYAYADTATPYWRMVYPPSGRSAVHIVSGASVSGVSTFATTYANISTTYFPPLSLKLAVGDTVMMEISAAFKLSSAGNVAGFDWLIQRPALTDTNARGAAWGAWIWEPGNNAVDVNTLRPYALFTATTAGWHTFTPQWRTNASTVTVLFQNNANSGVYWSPATSRVTNLGA